MDPYMGYVLAQFRSDVENQIKFQKKLESRYYEEKCIIKKLSIVNSLSFDNVLPKHILIGVFEYMGNENIRISKEIACGHFSRPNISTHINCKLFVEQLSCNSGNLKQFLVRFQRHHPDDQTQVLNLLSVSDIIRLFHVPNKMKSRVRECLTGVVKSSKIAKKSSKNARSVFSMQYPSSARMPKQTKQETTDVRTKLQKFDDMLIEYRRIGKINLKEERRLTGADQFDQTDQLDQEQKNQLLLNFEW
jgi:hypothetical protein